MRDNYVLKRNYHQKLVRAFKAQNSVNRDKHLFSIKSHDPRTFYIKVKFEKRENSGKITKLEVGNKLYFDCAVSDGFYDSISKLKSRNKEAIESSNYFADFQSDYWNILNICKTGFSIPTVSENEAFQLLQKMKPDVADYFSITPNHYNYAGPAGWKHFYFLLNTLINDVNNTDIKEINTVYAIILFKGHNKNKQSDRSYRTISTCPVIAKALDLYIRDLHNTHWNRNQAPCQFQGEGSSHELAAVLLTECIQHSLHHLSLPLYVLYLDAKSAFDVVQKELLIKNLYFSGTTGSSLIYLNNRLENRQTVLDWNGEHMGPIIDEQGLEQGGPNSSDFYKIFGREQLETAHASDLGVSLGPSLTISGIGQADDTLLVSNNIHALSNILKLTKIFCSKYQVNLCSEKTKLQAFHTKQMKFPVEYAKQTHSININNEYIDFSDTAEHVGMVRSVTGNLPTILARISAHKKALGAILHTGIARGHRGNPAASLHVQRVYASPVLFSGLAALVLSVHETNVVNQHYKENLRRLQRLLPQTPQPVIYFLAGSLPGSALLHLRQLSLFGMITRLRDSTINIHAKNIFNNNTISPKSWFHQIRNLCLKYDLPHPSALLLYPPSKHEYKRIVKQKIINYWELSLRNEAKNLTSLEFFHPEKNVTDFPTSLVENSRLLTN